ncbi:MAG: NADH:flavin oxidoreductase [Desulfosalsimonas sp.]|uniref:oxidoreductase n=1 Tax=Desulfosalsimonas sp. TaxID=3073848 RepID=UPI003970C813
MYSTLFSPIEVGGIRLDNRITMAPLYLGYAAEGGAVSKLLLEHYRLMAQSGAAMIVVENATVDHPVASAGNRTIRIDADQYLEGLTQLAKEIKNQGALACIQINHAGRFAGGQQAVAPSEVDTFGKTPRALSIKEIHQIRDKFRDAAKRAKQAGFDMVELHGGTGYLLAQFVSPHTNKRTDEYGGSLENRMKLPLEVLGAVRDAVGDFPVGYRFLADEFLDDGLKPGESTRVARALSDGGAAYLSVMGGTYESFMKPEIIAQSKTEGYMADLAAEIKKHVAVPVITAGRISSGSTAENILASGKADLVGLARVLFADPDWPKKIREGREDEIIHCDPECEDICMQLIMKGKPAFCTQWGPQKMRQFKDLFE